MEQKRDRVVIFNAFNVTSEAKRLGTDDLTVLKLLYGFDSKGKRGERINASMLRVRYLLANADNYLLNLKALIDSDVDLAYKLMYLQVSYCRSYSQYKLTGDPRVLLWMYPDLRVDLAKCNPLLRVEGNESITLLLDTKKINLTTH